MGREEGIRHAQGMGATKPAQLYKVDAEDLHDPGSVHLQETIGLKPASDIEGEYASNGVGNHVPPSIRSKERSSEPCLHTTLHHSASKRRMPLSSQDR